MYKTNCSETLIGWYRDEANNEMGCFYGQKVEGQTFINDLPHPDDNPIRHWRMQ